MVAQTEASELQEFTEDSPAEPEEVIEDTPEPSEEETPDPLQPVLERLGKVETAQSTLANLDPERLNRVLLMVPGLQSSLDKLKADNPLATLDPRFTANEALTAAVAEALINADSDLVNDESKTALRSTLTQVTEARTQRDREAMKTELLSEIATATTPDSTQGSTPEPPAPQSDTGAVVLVNQMTNQLAGYATAKGVDYSSIEPTVLQFQANEAIEVAFDRVKAHIDGMADDDGAADRLAVRQGAASATPSRSGGTTSIEDKKAQLQDGELPMSDTTTRAAIAREFGLTI